MTDLVMFDLDGTLVDTPAAIVETFDSVFSTMGVPALDPAVIRATIGLPIGDAFGSMLAVAPTDPRVDAAVALYREAFREIALPRAKHMVFPGVAEGLGALRKDGFVLAVATSKYQANAEALLEAAGLRDDFAMVLGADRVSRPKPDPETAHRIMRDLDAAPERTVMVGDTTHDVLMARAAGVDSVAVTYGIHSRAELAGAGPTWVADGFGEVVERIRARAEALRPPLRP